MLVLKAPLWRFHGADGGGRCFPSFERIAAAAKVSRDTAVEAVNALEVAGLLTWVNRITGIRRRERDLFGQLVTVWQVIRTSNAYRFLDPLACEPGRKAYKSENPARPQNQDLLPRGPPLPVILRVTMKQRVSHNGAGTYPAPSPGEMEGLRLLLAEREETMCDLRPARR
ncbi:MAG: helix-turn-helix domain-containing protein [Alphaproteobacteria bacterium]|nr:helix-turn-helix domain-containing protein [Alphaproteobacteria bacterium]